MSLAKPTLALTTLESVQPPRALRKLATILFVGFLILPPALLLVPWQQNVQAQGRVTALDPLDRTQMIPAPVSGRLVELFVQEGAFVKGGEILARMADQDPQYAMRLEQQIQFTRDKVNAANGMVEFYDQQLRFLEEARDDAITSARFDYNVAVENVSVFERELEAVQATLVQKRADRERKSTLWERGVVSELDFQRAEADYLSSEAKAAAALGRVAQARSAENAKKADMGKIASDQQARIESTKSAREEARSKVALAEKELNEATTNFERQKTQVVVAPRTGYVLRIYAASSVDLVRQGAPLIELIPQAEQLGVELWVRGVDAPLITRGRKVRLQFEGWPAVQFSGWPSVAVGTFGGLVSVVDAQATSDGRFRVLVHPDPNDSPWPDLRYLRQGVRTNGWLLLDTVSLGYEIWRQLNAFPPSVRNAPEASEEFLPAEEGKAPK